jgi:hypothetical protein
MNKGLMEQHKKLRMTSAGTRPEWMPLVNGLIRTIRELMLKVEAADLCDTLGTIYRTAWHHIPKENYLI